MGKLFDFSVVFSAIPSLLKLLPVTLLITVIAMVVGLILGFIFAIVRMNKVPVLSQMIGVFISFVRGTPTIVQLYLTYNGIPLLLLYLNQRFGTDYNINNVPALTFVLVTFGLSESAYNSETIRAALQSVGRGQIEAAQSLGMTSFQVLRRIVVPESIAVAIPPLGNSLISLLKGTSLAFTAGVIEMTAQAKIISGANFRFFEVYLALALIYWGITILIERMLKYTEGRFTLPARPKAARERDKLAMDEGRQA